MEFAPVMPINFYPLLDRGTYHMVQSHLLSHATPETVTWFLERGVSNDDHLVILDNGTIELGAPSIDTLRDSIQMIHPDLVVVPDILMESEQTLDLFEDWLPLMPEMMDDIRGFMLVPQGKSVPEWCYCAYNMMMRMNQTQIPYCLGIPKMLDDEFNGTYAGYYGGRYAALAWLRSYNESLPSSSHLLGIRTNLYAMDQILTDFPDVIGVDSTLPFAQAARGQLSYETYDKPFIDEEMWVAMPDEEAHRDVIWTAEVNIAWSRKIVESYALRNVSLAVSRTIGQLQVRAQSRKIVSQS